MNSARFKKGKIMERMDKMKQVKKEYSPINDIIELRVISSIVRLIPLIEVYLGDSYLKG
jgi:hypothetical protein